MLSLSKGPFCPKPAKRRFMDQLIKRGGRPLTVNQGHFWVRGILGPRPPASRTSPSVGSFYLGCLEWACEQGQDETRDIDFKPLWTELLQNAAILLDDLAGKCDDEGSGESSKEGSFTSEIICPLNESSWFGYRLRIDAEPNAYSWEPERVPGLEGALRDSGYMTQHSYRSVGSENLSEFCQRVEGPYLQAIEMGFKFDPLQSFGKADQQTIIKSIWSLCNRAFSQAPYFAEISFGDFMEHYFGNLDDSGLGNQKLVNTICTAPSGEVAGFILGYRDRCELVFKSMAIGQEFQGRRLGDAVLYPIAKDAVDLGIHDFVSALVLSGNRSEFVFRKNPTRWEHHYSVYRMGRTV